MAEEKKTMENATLEELLAGRERAEADFNFKAVESFNETLKRRFDYTDPVPEADKPLSEREGGAIGAALDVAPDLAAGLASGLYRGGAAIADLPADTAQLATTGIEAGTKFLTGKPPSEDFMAGITAGMEALPLIGDIRKYAGMTAGMAEQAAPELYNFEPETFGGDVLQTAGEFAIGAGRRKVAQALVPAAAVETVKASNLPENVKMPLEIASILLTPTVYKRVVSPTGGAITGKTKEALQLLAKEGVFPSAGQKAGDKGVKLMEEGSAAGRAIQETALRNFTKAAFKRIGITKLDNIENDMNAVYRRIGADLDITIGSVSPTATLKESADLARIMQTYTGQAAEMTRAPIFSQVFQTFGRSYQNKKAMTPTEIRYLHSTLNSLTRRGDAEGEAARAMLPIVKAAIMRELPKDAQKRWVNANREYRDFLAIEDALAKGDNLARGVITPSALKASSGKTFGKRNFVFGKDELSELATAGQLALKVEGTSNTAERLMAQSSSVGAGTMGAAALNALQGNPVEGSAALTGAAIGMAGIPVRNMAAGTQAGQAFLANQLVGELDEGMIERGLMQYLASYGVPSGLQ